MNLTDLEMEKLVDYLESLKIIIETCDMEELIEERDKYYMCDIEIIDKIIKKVNFKEGG